MNPIEIAERFSVFPSFSFPLRERKGMKSMKSNLYRAIFFEKPDYIPMKFHINAACWHHYPQEWLVEQIMNHPFLFPGYHPPKLPYTPVYSRVARRNEPYTDDFGCRWETTDDGITGTVVGHPLADWSAYADYRFPDPECQMGIGPVDWAMEKERIDASHTRGEFVTCGLRHGHTFLQLSHVEVSEAVLGDNETEVDAQEIRGGVYLALGREQVLNFLGALYLGGAAGHHQHGGGSDGEEFYEFHVIKII